MHEQATRTSRGNHDADPTSERSRAPSPQGLLALQEGIGNAATTRLLARFKKKSAAKKGPPGRIHASESMRIADLVKLGPKELLQFFRDVNKGEWIPEPTFPKGDEGVAEVASFDEAILLQRCLILDGLERASWVGEKAAKGATFKKAVQILERLGDDLSRGPASELSVAVYGESALLGNSPPASGKKERAEKETEWLAWAYEQVISVAPTAPPLAEAPSLPPRAFEGVSLADFSATGSAKKEVEAPKTGKRLMPKMSPEAVEAAIRGSAGCVLDETGMRIKRDDWLSNDYRSTHDRLPTEMGGTYTEQGFSTEHWFVAEQAWVIHVHRRHDGSIRFGNAQGTTLAGMAGVKKEPLTDVQLTRIGIPEYAKYSRAWHRYHA